MKANFPVDEATIADSVASYWRSLGQVIDSLPETHLSSCLALINDTKQNGGRVFTAGNGGSLFGAQWIARALVAQDYNALPLTQTPFDELNSQDDYDKLFVKEIPSLNISTNDLLIVLSGSGNSPNIIAASEAFLERRAQVFGLSGRDGGKLARVLGASRVFVAKTESMEMLEDAHIIFGQCLIDGAQDRAFSFKKKAYLDAFKLFANHNNQLAVIKLCKLALETALEETQLLVISADLGGRHLRSDAQRGWTNAIPIRGFLAPELYTDNSGTATANDDGIHYLLADGLAKLLRAGDLALVFDLPGTAPYLPPCLELLARTQQTIFTVGQTPAADLDAGSLLEHFPPDFISSHMGHICGDVIRKILWDTFTPREFVLRPGDLIGRKTSLAHTEALESHYRHTGTLAHDEVLTFAYGKAYAVKSPEVFEVRRVHY